MIPENIRYEIAATKEIYPTIVVSVKDKMIPLHSRFRPTGEAKSFIGRFDPDRFDFLVVLGIGLGYHLIHLKDIAGKFKKIILIDIIKGIENEISNIDITSFLASNEKIEFISGLDAGAVEEKLADILKIENVRGISVLEHPASVRIFGRYYGEIKKAVGKIIDRKAGSLAAKNAFGLLFIKNIIKNLSVINKCSPVKNLYGKLKGYPAVVVAPGPSLERHIEDLIRKRESLFIIAVDSALPVLVQNNIFPDFVVSIDPQPYIYEHISGYFSDMMIPVFSISADPRSLEKVGGYISLNSHPLAQVIARIFPDSIGSVDSSTGSVAGDALRLASGLGIKKTGLIGFDFSFSDYKIYSRGTSYQKRYSLFFHNRLSTTETLNMNYIFKSSKGFKNSGRYSRKSFLQYKESLEDFIKKEDTSISNINETGIDIINTEKESFERFAEKNLRSAINREKMIKLALRGSQPIGSVINISVVKEFILRGEIFNLILKESLPDAEDRIKDKIKRLIDSLL